MYNRYKGNGSRPIAVPDKAPPPKKPGSRKPPDIPAKPVPIPPRQENRLTGILPRSLGELETEDLLLLLILYLMYRESGDRDMLIIMGAMFLL